MVFGVILGTGVGGGIAIRQRIHEGPNAIAGEWGHNPLPWMTDEERAAAPACYCGKHGCIETFLSGPGFERDHARLSGAQRASQDIVRAAASGDADAIRTLERYDDRLARALASVINLLDPDVVVLGGGMSNLPDLPSAVSAAVAPVRLLRQGPDQGRAERCTAIRAACVGRHGCGRAPDLLYPPRPAVRYDHGATLPETHASAASYWRRDAQSLRRTRQDLAMTFKPAIWRPIAIVLSVINLVAAAFAAGSAEPLHAGVHVALGLAFGLWAQRLGRPPGPGSSSSLGSKRSSSRWAT